jgi:hypothetical protein
MKNFSSLLVIIHLVAASIGHGSDVVFTVELSSDDGSEIMHFFKGLSDRSRCPLSPQNPPFSFSAGRCLFASRERYWLLHRAVTDTILMLARSAPPDGGDSGEMYPH